MAIHFGIIGLGEIAKRFAGVLHTIENIELTAVASKDSKKAVQFAEKYHAAKYYTSYEDLMTDEDVDIIYIALTHNFHFEAVKKCLEHKKAVICEKPLVTNYADALELIQLSQKNQVLLMEAMWTRCIPTFQKAKEWILNGSIGTPKLVHASFSFNTPFNPENRLYNPDLAGGSLYDAGVYPIEFAIGILDETPTMTQGSASFCPTGVDDFVAMNMCFESGALAALSCGISANSSQNAFVYGTEGYVVVYDFLGSHKCERYDNQNQLMDSFEMDFEDGFVFEIQHVCQLMKEKQIESPLIPHKDSLACAGVFDTLKQQFKEQK